MKIIDANWLPSVNMLVILCGCGNTIRHPANRWHVTCRHCGRNERISVLRDKWVKEQEAKTKARIQEAMEAF